MVSWDLMVFYSLVMENHIANWKITMLLMVKSTVNGYFQQLCQSLPETSYQNYQILTSQLGHKHAKIYLFVFFVAMCLHLIVLKGASIGPCQANIVSSSDDLLFVLGTGVLCVNFELSQRRSSRRKPLCTATEFQLFGVTVFNLAMRKPQFQMPDHIKT